VDSDQRSQRWLLAEAVGNVLTAAVVAIDLDRCEQGSDRVALMFRVMRIRLQRPLDRLPDGLQLVALLSHAVLGAG
jgi:hypothetical protein